MNDNEPGGRTSRRVFLLRALKAGAAAGAAGFAAHWFHDENGPAARESNPLITLPDYSIHGEAGRMCIATGADRRRTLNRAMDALGGIGRFVERGDRVLLKVNAAFASPPILSATSNPELVGELARLCLQAGAASVAVADNPINDPASCFVLSGIERAARDAGASVILPAEDLFRPVTLEGGSLLRDWPFLYQPLEGIDKLIGVAPVKDHHRAGASMAMKNWYGLLGGRRNVFHQEINEVIKELALLVRPTLVVLDGTTTMMTNGPTGGSLSDLKATNTMVVSTDQVAADAFGATLLGRRASDLPYIAMAAAAGAGSANYELLDLVRVSAD